MITEPYKDILTIPLDNTIAICVPTNGVVKGNKDNVMGSGLALQFAKKYPELPQIIGQHIINKGNIPGLFRLSGFNVNVISFPTKQDWKLNSSLEIIERSAKVLPDLISTKGLTKIYLPRVGTGLGNLNLASVEPILMKYLDDRFILLK